LLDRTITPSRSNFSRLRCQGAHISMPSAQCLRFVRTGDHTAVVIGQHHRRPAPQVWLETTFAGRIEVVAIDQGDRRRYGLELADRAGNDAPNLKLLAFPDHDVPTLLILRMQGDGAAPI